MLTFIVNPAAGTGYSLKVEEKLRTILNEKKIPYKIIHTERPGHAAELAHKAAIENENETVIAVGGDGTAFEVACGIAGTGAALGIIPAGTGNDFIKSVGIPKDPEKALYFILNHEPRPVDFGSVNDQSFINVCGTGFDVTVLENMMAAKKRFRGILPYLIGLFKAIFLYKPIHVKLTIDGREEEKDLLICSVANGKFIGGGIPICPVAKPDDGKLDVVMVDDVPKYKIFFCLPALMTGNILKLKYTKHILCDSITICSENMHLNVDGEIFEMNEASFGIKSGSLRLIW